MTGGFGVGVGTGDGFGVGAGTGNGTGLGVGVGVGTGLGFGVGIGFGLGAGVGSGLGGCNGFPGAGILIGSVESKLFEALLLFEFIEEKSTMVDFIFAQPIEQNKRVRRSSFVMLFSSEEILDI